MSFTSINVIVYEPDKKPYLKSIPNTVASKQHIVGGPYCRARWRKYELTFISNRNQNDQNLPLNSNLGFNFRGTFLLARTDGPAFTSVTEDDVKRLVNCS